MDLTTIGDTIERLYNRLVRRLRDLPKPIVCAVNGVAAGAGANLALACDIVLAARSATFIQAFCKIGLVPDTGGTYFLPRLVGSARALALTLTGEPVSGEQAAAWGMIWRAVDDAQLMPEARDLARRLAAGGAQGPGPTPPAPPSPSASTSHNHSTVAAAAEIQFLSPGRAGETLVAVARERIVSGRTGIYDVDVTERASGRLIALFRGRSQQITGTVVPDAAGGAP